MSRLPCTCCTAYLVCFITKYVFFYALAICKKFEKSEKCTCNFAYNFYLHYCYNNYYYFYSC